MKKKLIVILMLLALMMVIMPIQPVQAMSGACEKFATTMTNSFSQAWWYVACVAEIGAWEVYYTFS